MKKIASVRELYNQYSKNVLTKPSPLLDELWYSRVIGRKISIFFTWLFLHTELTPNHVSFLALAAAILGGIFLAQQGLINFLIGFLLFHLYIILDSTDGELARIKKMRSDFGFFFDRVLHLFAYISLFLGIAGHLFLETNSFYYLFLGASASLLVILASAVYFLDPAYQKVSFAERKAKEGYWLQKGKSVYNFLTGDIEITLILFAYNLLLLLRPLPFDAYELILYLNIFLLLFGGIIFNIYLKYKGS